MKKVTMADVAKKAGVSKSTVSQFINHRYEYMSSETKSRVEEAISTLGYQPNILARSLKQKRTSTIGVIVANILHTFSTQVIRSIEDVCQGANVSVIVCNADDQPEKEKNYIDILRAKQVDGLIIFPTGGNYQLYQQLIAEQFPLVFMDRFVEGVHSSAILLDNDAAMEMAVEHLYEQGFRKIGMLTTSIERKITPRVERLEAYKKSLLTRQIPLHSEYFKAVELKDMQAVLTSMFNQPEPPDALISGNDFTLHEVLRFVQHKGLSIPDDLALISIDEVSFSEIYTPSLTIIDQPAFEMGSKAAEILLQQINSDDISETAIIRFPPKLIIRKST